MAYEEEFWQEIVRILILISILSAVMRRQKTRKKPQEHDERFLWRIVSDITNPSEVYAEENRL